jgi:hypothetical protein
MFTALILGELQTLSSVRLDLYTVAQLVEALSKSRNFAGSFPSEVTGIFQ